MALCFCLLFVTFKEQRCVMSLSPSDAAQRTQTERHVALRASIAVNRPADDHKNKAVFVLIKGRLTTTEQFSSAELCNAKNLLYQLRTSSRFCYSCYIFFIDIYHEFIPLTIFLFRLSYKFMSQ